MGNAESAVVQKRMTRFRPEERPVIDGVFNKLTCGGGDPADASGKPAAGTKITLEMIQSSLGSFASDSLVQRVFHCLVSIDPELAAPAPSGRIERLASSQASREQLVIFLADTLRGTAEERAPLVLTMSQFPSGGGTTVSCEQVAQFLQELIAAVVQILVKRGRLDGWKAEHMSDSTVGVKLLAEQICSELKPSDQGDCDVSCLEDWIFRTPQVSLYLEMLVDEGLGVSLNGSPPPTLLPPCRDTAWGQLDCLLDIPTLMFLAPQVPDGLSAPWRLAFSTQLHGESFTRMMASLTHGGPSLLLIKDTTGHVFGGFASHTWDLKPQFQGDSRCFLFSIFPKMRVYTATGYNEHFMYLNQHQQTMPNGLGMGGQHEYFGLWLDSDFGRGHSRARPKCTTYSSPQLSGDEDFTLDSMEVWHVGKPPKADEEEEEEEGKKSILFVDPEVQALMEMTGKTLHSEGLREPEDED